MGLPTLSRCFNVRSSPSALVFIRALDGGRRLIEGGESPRDVARTLYVARSTLCESLRRRALTKKQRRVTDA